MNSSMISSMTTMHGLQQKLDMLSNNIANMNTVGYKRQDASFQDILTSYSQQNPHQQLPGRLTSLGLTEGWGAKLARQQIDFNQGAMQATENPTDLAIEGNGLFEIDRVRVDAEGQPVLDANGLLITDRAWTRNGAFQLTTRPGDTDNAYLATEQGYLLTGMLDELIAIPNTHSMDIDANGRVFIRNNQEDNALPEQIAQLKIARVFRPQELVNLGNNMYGLPNGNENENINEILQVLDMPETAGISVRQGYLEQSNVNLANEMAELINIQRAYQLNSRALMSSDTMMNLANQLRG
jgi:flagellar basal-body rod protein FlgG